VLAGPTEMAKVGLEMKLLTSEVDAEAEKWDEYAENDIVKRAKASFVVLLLFTLRILTYNKRGR